jgi:integrase
MKLFINYFCACAGQFCASIRHTYATLGLMSGANPAFLAKQLGHSLQMFFNVYADWIDGANNDLEMEKIDASIRRVNPDLSLKIASGDA